MPRNSAVCYGGLDETRRPQNSQNGSRKHAMVIEVNNCKYQTDKLHPQSGAVPGESV